MANIDVTQIPNKAVKFCASKTRAEAAADARSDANKGTIYFCKDGGIVLNGGVYAEANTIEKVKINGIDVEIQHEAGIIDTPYINIPIGTGDSAGEIKINNQAVAVNGFTTLSESHNSLAQTVQSIQDALNAEDAKNRKFALTPENLAEIKTLWTDGESSDAIAIITNKSAYFVVNADATHIYTCAINDRRNSGNVTLEYRKFRITDATSEIVESLQITGEQGISTRIDAKADSSTVTSLESSVVKKTGTTGDVILPATSYIGSVSNSSPNNKIATMADITGSIAGLAGAMHFEGVKESIPSDLQNYEAGDVIIVGTKEYVLTGDGTEGNPKKWVELGDEGIYLPKATVYNNSDNDKGVAVTLGGTAESPTIDLAVTLGTVAADNGSVVSGGQVKSAIDNAISGVIAELDGDIIGTAGQGKTLTAFSQTDGKVTATFADIKINQTQVTNLTADLSEKANADDLSTLESRVGTAESDIDALQAKTAIIRDSSSGGKIIGQENTSLTVAYENAGDEAKVSMDFDGVLISTNVGGIALVGGEVTSSSDILIGEAPDQRIAVRSSIEAMQAQLTWM